MSSTVRFYNWLNNTFVQKIMFKNRREELEALKKEHAAGGIKTPTELEHIMLTEAKELVRNQYANLDGALRLQRHVKEAKQRQSSAGKTGAKFSLLQHTGLDRKIRLKDLQKTWEFTRGGPLVLRFIETFFYILISNTQNIIYLSMIYSMYENAGIISLFYPIMVFGFAALEEVGPTGSFWDTVRRYTVVLTIFKFVLNIEWFGEWLRTPTVVRYVALLKIGIYDYDKLSDLFAYMLPEILIITFLMLNEIKMKLLGVYYEDVLSIETIL